MRQLLVVTRNKETKASVCSCAGKRSQRHTVGDNLLGYISGMLAKISQLQMRLETILTESSFNGWLVVREKELNTVYSVYGSLNFQVFSSVRYF